MKKLVKTLALIILVTGPALILDTEALAQQNNPNARLSFPTVGVPTTGGPVGQPRPPQPVTGGGIRPYTPPVALPPSSNQNTKPPAPQPVPIRPPSTTRIRAAAVENTEDADDNDDQ